MLKDNSAAAASTFPEDFNPQRLETYIIVEIASWRNADHLMMPIEKQNDISALLKCLHEEMVKRTGDPLWFKTMPKVTWTSLVYYYTTNNMEHFVLVTEDLKVWTNLKCPTDTSGITQFSEDFRRGIELRSRVWRERRNPKVQADHARKPNTLRVFYEHPAHTKVCKLALWYLLRPFA